MESQTILAILATLWTAVFLWNRRHKGPASKVPASSVPNIEVPDSVRRVFMFWGGAISGIISAASTHSLEVLKIRQHVGRSPPETPWCFFFGLPMGSFAQGQRFAATLVLDAVLQKRLTRWQEKAKKRGGRSSRILSFLFSMVAAGSAELLSNPPVVVKNYQIANSVTFSTACHELWMEDGFARFFSGVSMGVLRKSLANAIVLQTIGPVKQVLGPTIAGIVSEPAQQNVVLGFVAGSLTGGLAEVLTNHPDQVKTLSQTGMPFWQALETATRNPFRGALWAGLRKGVIRGINWGGLAMCMAFFEWAYRRRIAARKGKMGNNLEDGIKPALHGA